MLRHFDAMYFLTETNTDKQVRPHHPQSLKSTVRCCKPNKNIYPYTKKSKSHKPESLPDITCGFFTKIKIYTYTPQPVETMKNHQRKETGMKGNPSGRTKPMDNFIMIAGGIPAGTKMKGKKMDRHTHHKQQCSNSLQEPGPKPAFFHIYCIPV